MFLLYCPALIVLIALKPIVPTAMLNHPQRPILSQENLCKISIVSVPVLKLG